VATVADIFGLALQNHQAGNLGQAEQLYRQVLQAEPRHADSHHLLGVLAYQTGRHEMAVTSIRQALSLNPLAGLYFCNLGLALEALGKPAEAQASFQQAIRFQPDYAEAHCNLANSMLRQGRREEAATHYKQALQLKSDYAEAHCGLGVALGDLGRLDEAVDHLRQALRLQPNYADAHNNVAKPLIAQGKIDEAIAHWRQAIRIRPNFAEPHNNLGNTLLQQDKLQESEASYREALRINPLLTAAHHGLGNALERQDKLDEAIGCYRQALRLSPNLGEAWNNLANTLTRQFKIEEAIDCYRQALRLKPDYAEAFYNLGNAFCKQGSPEQALTSFHQALRLEPDLAKAQSNVLFCLNYHPDANPDAVFAEHRRWGEKRESIHRAERELHCSQHAQGNNPDRRLRIGYISPDLRFHPLTRYIEPVLAHHDKAKVEVFCYAEVQKPDAVTSRLQRFASGWRSTCSLTDSQVAERIRGDKIDILIDLAGHTADNRLGVLACKPAPVQATWLGYMNTTGLCTVDYRLTDDVLDPPGQPVCDTEELLRLPGGMCCFAPPEDAPPVSPLPALRRGHLVFGSLHNPFKLNVQVFDLWSRVLKAVPTAKLLMFHDFLLGTAQDRIRRLFAERGISSDRLDLRQGSCAPGYLGVYDQVDISLDPFPCTGGVTTCESLWMGVPVVSLCGVRPAGRNSAAILARVGLGEWAVPAPEEYISLAARQVDELDRLADLRSQLRDRMRLTLCDAERFTRDLEDAYRTMWRRWCNQGERPALVGR
jgi:protein O-GlcNAc transferase